MSRAPDWGSYFSNPCPPVFAPKNPEGSIFWIFAENRQNFLCLVCGGFTPLVFFSLVSKGQCHEQNNTPLGHFSGED